MKTLFCIFPHCYVKVTNRELLVYDTLKYNNLYFTDYEIAQLDRDTLSKGYIFDRDETKQLISSLLTCGMGYYLEYGKTLPYLNDRKIKFTISLEKEYRSLSHNLASYTNTLLKTTTILCNNSIKSNYSDLEHSQIGYPIHNCCKIDYSFILQQLHSFPYLERIIISGEIEEQAYASLLSFAKKNSISLTHRVFLEKASIEKILNDLEENDILFVEVIVDRNSDLSNLAFHDRLYYKALVNDVSDVSLFSNLHNVSYTPIISKKEFNEELLKQMIMTKEEVLSFKSSKRTCLLSDFINSAAFGTITINYDYNVSCVGQHIGSIQDTDLSNLINKWIRNEHCMWYFYRGKKDSCQDCALSSLCPSINIYETQGIYQCPCNKLND